MGSLLIKSEKLYSHPGLHKERPITKVKKIWIIVSCLLIFGVCVFCTQGFLKKEGREQIIPIKILHGLPLINVNIQGHKLQLILDLGSSSSSLSKEIIEKIQLAKLDKTTNSMDAYGKKSIHPVFCSSNVLIGNYLMPYLEFNESKSFNDDFESHTPKILTYGKIGRESFFDKVLFIDRKQELCVVDQACLDRKVDPRKYKQGEWIETDFNLDKGRGISLCLLTDLGREIMLILDTGSNISLINEKFSPQPPIDLRNKPEKISLKLNNGVFLGTFSLYPFDFTSAGLQGILGFDFFDHYMVCFDFLNKKMFLKSYEKTFYLD